MTAGEVRAWLRESYGIAASHVERVARGADRNASVWHAVAGDREYAVKVSGGGTVAGILVTAHLAARGVPGIAGPLPATTGALWDERGGVRLSVQAWIDGPHASDAGLTAAQWTAFGALLARVHATEPIDALPRDAYDPSDWVALMRDVSRRIADRGDGELAALWDGERVGALLDLVTRLAVELRGRRTQYVVCHTDPHLTNLLVARDGTVWLIDWDDATLAPRERDLMFVGGGIDAVTDEQRAWFFAGYGDVDVDADRITYHRAVRAMEDAGGYAAVALDPASDGATRAHALGAVRHHFSPAGLVTLALTAGSRPRPSGR